MKINSLKFLISFLAVILLSSGCDKEDKVASKVTFWPNIEINGDEFVVVELGDAYEDASATVTVNGAGIPFETVSDVDDSEVGAYTVSYTAVNEDGISASKVRTVIVVDPAAADDDLTGSFTRVGQAGTVINWAKHPTKPFTYIANNVGGVPPSNASYAVFNAQFLAYNVAPVQTVAVHCKYLSMLQRFLVKRVIFGQLSELILAQHQELLENYKI